MSWKIEQGFNLCFAVFKILREEVKKLINLTWFEGGKKILLNHKIILLFYEELEMWLYDMIVF